MRRLVSPLRRQRDAEFTIPPAAAPPRTAGKLAVESRVEQATLRQHRLEAGTCAMRGTFSVTVPEARLVRVDRIGARVEAATTRSRMLI